MRSPSSLMLLISTLLFTLVKATTSRSITVYTWPLTAAKPTELARVAYDTSTETSTTSKYTAPDGPYNADERIRVGFYDAKHGAWQGVVASAASFDPSLQQKLSLLLDAAGETYHIGFGAVERSKAPATEAQGGKRRNPKGAKPAADEPLVVELVKPSTSPSPVLNKPVKLDPKGKVANKEEEKTFLQKYWWAIAGFLLIQLVMGGGKE